MMWKRNHERRASRGLLGLLAALGIFMLVRELPAMRRYLRMERM
jgi:hypothetical protein